MGKVIVLNASTGWRGHPDAEDVTAHRGALELAARVDGPLGLDSPDGTLGRLIAPRTIAVHETGGTFLLTSDARIEQLDPRFGEFAPLGSLGGAGVEARELDEPRGIAVTATHLCVLERARVQVFELRSLALVAVVTWLSDLVDIAAIGDDLFVLHGAGSMVTRIVLPAGRHDLVVDQPFAGWDRLAVDRGRRLYLRGRDDDGPMLDVFDADPLPGQRPRLADDRVHYTRGTLAVFRCVEVVRHPGMIRDRFDPPLVVPDAGGRFCVGLRTCDRGIEATREVPPSIEYPLSECRRAGQGADDVHWLSFDAEGRRIEALPSVPPEPGYVGFGTWRAQALDSEIYRCQWHRVELEHERLPQGSSVVVETATSDEEHLGSRPEWVQAGVIEGSISNLEGSGGRRSDFLVQSDPGRYLHLRLRLRGAVEPVRDHDPNARAEIYAPETPAITAIRLELPRESYVEHLPAVFSEDGDGRRFLEQFLSVFQTEWDGLERNVETMYRMFDPRAAEGGAWLSYLASWLGVTFEGEWSDEQRRNLLAATPSNLERRGTGAGLRHHLAAYLQNFSGCRDLRGFPHVVEGFRARNYLALARERADVRDALGSANEPRLWGPGIVGRTQLDVYSRDGESRLIGVGDAERDAFHTHAHQFQVFVPSAWVQSRRDELRLRGAIREESPAHSCFEVCLVEPRLRVGVQSTVGLDTIVGGRPTTRLQPVDQSETPHGRPPRARLGYDTVLAGGSRDRPIGTGVRVGIDTRLM